MASKINTTETIRKAAFINEGELDKMLNKTNDEIRKAPKTRVRIPVDPMNPGEPVYVGINGYNLLIPRGVTVELPQPVVYVLEEAGII